MPYHHHINSTIHRYSHKYHLFSLLMSSQLYLIIFPIIYGFKIVTSIKIRFLIVISISCKECLSMSQLMKQCTVTVKENKTFIVKVPCPSKMKKKLPGKKPFKHRKNNRMKLCQQKLLRILFKRQKLKLSKIILKLTKKKR